LRRFFNWCLERELIHTSPVARIRPPASERSRDRVLNDDEICRFWDGCERLGWPFGPAYQLLLVTGQRRNEVAGMRWEDVDLDDGVWTIPREETKTTRQHEVFLAPLAVELLRGLPCLGEYAITTNGRTPVSGFSASKKRLDDIIGISDWRLHDLRRTAASKMAEIGVAPHVIDKVQNRATGAISGVAAAYNRHEHRQEKRDALYAWGKALDAIIRSVEPKLIQLKSERT
jgi:integrase